MKKILLLAIAVSITALNSLAQYQCSDIYKEIDDFDNTILFKSPLATENIQVTKYKDYQSIRYFVSFSIYSNELYADMEVFDLLFTDKTPVVHATAPINTDYLDGQYVYSITVAYTEEDFLKYTQKDIWKFRIGHLVYQPSAELVNKVKFYANCLLSK